MTAKVIGWIQAAGPPVRGLWCPRCALPSGIEICYTMLTETGVSPLTTIRRCVECGEPIDPAAPTV